MKRWQKWCRFLGVAALLGFCIAGRPGLVAAQVRSALKIVVVDGEGAVNNLQFGSAKEPVVEIRDENDIPLAGAIVTFSLPESGAGGSFFGVGTNLTVTTNQQGRATGARFRQNSTEGRFQIRVTAALGNRTGAVNINQSNVLNSENIDRVLKPDKKFSRGKIIAIVTAGAIIGAVVAARDGKSETETAPGTTITPGTVSVGTPR